MTVEVEVETWCSKKRHMEIILLECDREPKGELVDGKPIHCSDEKVCSKGELCLLNALRIETRRR